MELYGAALARVCTARGVRTIGLVGELGSGKSTFVRGFARGLGVRERTTSPTFLILRPHRIRHPRYETLYHCDFYRVRTPNELIALGVPELFRDPRNLFIIEWADRAARLLPRRTVFLQFAHGRTAQERTVRILPAPRAATPKP